MNIEFKEINLLLERLFEISVEFLRSNEKGNKVFFEINNFIEVNQKTYNCIKFLITNEGKFLFQAYILTRSLLDSFFTITFILDDLEKNYRIFVLSKYKQLYLRFESESKYLKEIGDAKRITEWENCLDSFTKTYNINKDEVKVPNKLSFWPIPSQVIKSKFSNEKTKLLLSEIYENKYKEISEYCHVSSLGIDFGLFSQMPETHASPGNLESIIIYNSILFNLLIFSEINSNFSFPNKNKILEIWNLLNPGFAESKEIFEIKYKLSLK